MGLEIIKKMFENSFKQDSKKRFTVKIGQHLKVILIDEMSVFLAKIKELIFILSTIEIT